MEAWEPKYAEKRKSIPGSSFLCLPYTHTIMDISNECLHSLYSPRQQFWEHFHNLLWTFQLYLLVQKRNSWSIIKCYKGYLLLLGNNSDCSELNLNILVVESFKGILHFEKGLIGKLFKIALWINMEFPFEMPDWRGCSTSIWTSRGTSVQTKHKVGSSWLNQRAILGCQISVFWLKVLNQSGSLH